MYMTKTHWNTNFFVENYEELLQRCTSNSETPNTVSITNTDVNNLPNFLFENLYNSIYLAITTLVSKLKIFTFLHEEKLKKNHTTKGTTPE